jgi:hypothetical protein
MWSENPTNPPDAVEPTDTALATADEQFSHGELLDACEGVVEDWDLDETDEVAIRAPLSDPGTVVAGVLAPIRVGATVLLDRDQAGSVAVAAVDENAPEETVIDPTSVF